MKRFLIKFLAFSLLAQSIIANPLMMHGMRSPQSMAVMRAVLNNQKQNAGIFNKDVQKRTVIITHEPKSTAVLSVIEIIAGICTGGAIVLTDKSKKGKYEEEFIQNQLARIAQEKAKSLPYYQEPIAYDMPPWMETEKKYPAGFVHGFERSDDQSAAGLFTAPANNPASVPSTAPNPALPLTAPAENEKNNVTADVLSAVVHSGDLAQKGAAGAQNLIRTVNDLASNHALATNPINSLPGQGDGMTLGDIAKGTGLATATKVAATEVAKTTMWESVKATLAPYVQPIGTAVMGAVKGAAVFAVANPGTCIVGGAVVLGGGYKIYDWWKTPALPKDPNCVLPAADPLAGATTHHPAPATEMPKNTGYGSTVPEQTALTPQEVPDLKDPLVFEKNKAGAEKVRANNEPDAPRETGAQAPGIPREEDGYVPPKKWNGEKTRVEIGKFKGRYGWPDKKGSVWVPSGPDGHGGPHWDVQHPDGSYENIVPGGGIRGAK